MEITFVTGNKMKIKACREAFKNTNIEINNITMDIPEEQCDSVIDVAIEKAKYAYYKIKKPIINDCGLIIPSLNGFPGPYTKYVEQTIKEDGILDLMLNKKNRETYYLDILVYIDDKEIKTFECKTEGSISLKKEGTNGYGYDKIFIPKGEDRVMALMKNEEILKVWINTTYNDLYEYIKNKEN